MKRIFLIVIGLLVAWTGPAAAQTSVGINATVENSVRTRSAGETGWRPSLVDQTVRQADAIVTGDQSRLRIRMSDQSVLTVGANASLTVDRFVIDTEAEPTGVLFSMARGAFRFVSGSRGAERERVAFATPTATIGIRGTIIEGAVGAEALELLAGEGGMPDLTDDPDQAAVIVLVEGEIEIEVDGVRRIVREPGQAVFVSGRRVSEPFRLSPEAGQRLQGRLPPREPGGPGVGPQGQGPASRPPQGGSTPPGQPPQGSAPEGQAPQGQAPQGQTPQGESSRGPGDRAGPSRPAPAGSTSRPRQGGGRPPR